MTTTDRKATVRRLYSSPHHLAAIVLAGTLALSGLAACGSDAKKSDSTAAAADTMIAPEEVKVAPAIVTAGLTKLPATIASAIGAIGTPSAKEKLDAIEAEWFSFEGTVRDTDTTLYLDIEDQLTPLQRQIEDGDATTATATAATLSGLFGEYLAKYP
jgi:hypothetical protein